MFETGKSVPADKVQDLLNNLVGRRLTFYCLTSDNFRNSTYVVSNAIKGKLVEKLIVPSTKCLPILGPFETQDVVECINDVKDRIVPNESKGKPSYILNEATGRMVRIGSRRYKELYPGTKKRVGRPKKVQRGKDLAFQHMEAWMKVKGKPWISLIKDSGLTPKGLLDAWQGMLVFAKHSNGKVYELSPNKHGNYLEDVVRDGYSKYGTIELSITGNPKDPHVTNIRNIGFKSKNNKPINPKTLA